MLRSLHHSARLLGIVLTLARHNALFPLERIGVSRWLLALLSPLGKRGSAEPGARLAAAFEALGPLFVKFGQGLSTRADMVGEENASHLARLRDKLAPFPFAQAKAAIEGELRQPLAEAFMQFEETPVATASIAQVHFAVTAEGKEVAVKVLRPGVEAMFLRDMELLAWIARLVERWFPRSRRLRPVEAVETITASIRQELDLRLEAASADELRENLKDDTGFEVPEIDWQRSARRVLVLSRVRGIPIGDVAALKAAGHDMQKLVQQAAHSFFIQVFRDGFFHADLHPGNLFVTETGAIAAVDFGIMGRLDRTTRRFLAEMLLGFLKGDYRRVAELHFEAGYVPHGQSLEQFTLAVRAITRPIFGKPLEQISLARLLAQLFQVTEAFDMRTQPQLLLLQKTMMMAEGLGRMLAPEANMWKLAEPLAEAWMHDNLGPRARLEEGFSELAALLNRLPAHLREAERIFARMAERGNCPPPPPVYRSPLALAGAALAGALLALALAS